MSLGEEKCLAKPTAAIQYLCGHLISAGGAGTSPLGPLQSWRAGVPQAGSWGLGLTSPRVRQGHFQHFSPILIRGSVLAELAEEPLANLQKMVQAKRTVRFARSPALISN